MGRLNQSVSDTYTGTGAAQTITLGFKPKAVFVFNETDGDSFAGHFEGMAAATGFSIGAATAAVASQGITLTSRGFSLGTDVSVNENAKVFRYLAIN
jgi:hypothetical protein